jgi:NAD(P)-dependent dehydrogenase (short-subunit alcohol dehydrogenase family)
MVGEVPIYPVLVGKVAIVTDGTRGICQATTEVVLKAGAKIIIAGIRTEKGRAVTTELSKFGDT